jgi:hypothetical protein
VAGRWDALLVVCPEHARTFRSAGWSKTQLRSRLNELLTIPAQELLRDVDGCAEGFLADQISGPVRKFREGGLLIAQAGGPAGMFSAIIGGWSGGLGGSEPVTREVLS